MSPMSSIKKPVRIWLFAGVLMIFIQVILGGITRLTDSGLSITEWAVIQGTLPPLNETAWKDAFEKYKKAAHKQFETLHADMRLSNFKFIYFWEYTHRLWARTMGFVFLLPFLFFLWKKWLPKWLVKRLGMVLLLAALAATIGWIMVASGLNDPTRTWVSAYNLSIHLSIATTLFGFLFWTWLLSVQPSPTDGNLVKLKRQSNLIVSLLFLQIIFGGLMAGMRAGLIHPYFPFFVEGDRFLNALAATSEATVKNFVDYEPSRFVKAVVQIIHRGTAYLIACLVIWFFIKARKEPLSDKLSLGNTLLISMLIIQFSLGIFTIINSVGKTPLTYAALHQGGALLFFGVALFVNFQFHRKRNI